MRFPPKRDHVAAWRLLAASMLAGALMVVPEVARAQEKAAVNFRDAAIAPLAPEDRSIAIPISKLPEPALRVQDPQEQSPDERMTTSGFFLGIVGMLAGAAVGSGVGNARCGDDCVTRYAAGGATAVGGFLVPVGVRIANDDDRNPFVSFAASLGMGAALFAGFNQVPGRPVAFAPFVAAPLQVWLVSKLERR